MSPYYSDDLHPFLVNGEIEFLTEEEAEEKSGEVIDAYEPENLLEDNMKRYPTLNSAPSLRVASEVADQECECKPDLPDGRSFPMCLPCKMRQDLERFEEDLRISVLDLEPSEDDIPFLF